MDIVTLAASRKYTDKKIMESAAVGIKYEMVDSLPSSGKEQTIYFVKNNNSLINDYYDEYVWISSSSAFEKIGNTQIDSPTTQPDWNQNDATQPDYIKNRPFYTGDPVETVLLEESTVAFADNGGNYLGQLESTFSATVGETYKVFWDGVAYESTCVDIQGDPAIGNLSIVGENSDTGEPFLMLVQNGKGMQIGTLDTASSHTISISGMVASVVKIDEKYFPDNLATKSDIDDCMKLFNNGHFKIHVDDNNYFVGNSYNDKTKYSFSQNGDIDTPIVFCIGKDAEKNFSISVNTSASPTVKITPPLCGDKQADIEFDSFYGGKRPQITGLGGITMHSSTSGSTKKFKITVDDTGTISATEVT